MALKITKQQYGQLIREIEKSLKDNISGGGLYDFGAPDAYEAHPMGALQFWVADPDMEGGGFFSSIGKAFRNVYGALKNSGVIDKAKDAALKKGRELGGQAISAAAQKVDQAASQRGFDTSGLTAKAAGRAHEALHDAEGHAQKLMNTTQASLEKKAGIDGSGMYQSGRGMYLSGGGGGFISAPRHTPGLPKGATLVGNFNHLQLAGKGPTGGY